MDWSKFSLRDGKWLRATPCVELVAFSYEPPVASGPGFDRFLRMFAERFGARLSFYRTGDMKRFRPVDARTLEGPFHWFTQPKMLATKMLALVAHAGETERNMAPPAIKLMLWGFDEPPCFVFRMALPIALAETPDDLVRFAQEALAEFPLENGYCGYSFLWDETAVDDDVFGWVMPLLLRHPGLSYGSPVPFSNAANQGLAAVSWLTFLGPRTAADLGGATP